MKFPTLDIMILGKIPIPISPLIGIQRSSYTVNYSGGLQKIASKKLPNLPSDETEYYFEPTQLIHTISFTIDKGFKIIGTAFSDFFSLIFPFLQIMDGLNINLTSNDDQNSKKLLIQGLNFCYFGADIHSPIIITNSFITNISYGSADYDSSIRTLILTLTDTSLIKPETLMTAGINPPTKTNLRIVSKV